MSRRPRHSNPQWQQPCVPARTTVRARTQAWHQRWHAVGRCLLVSCALFCAPSALASELLVLDFDLNDLTLMPQEQEIERAAELGPMLAETLDAAHGHTIIELPERAAAEAAKGKGYLYDKPALIADIGRQSKARWVISGRLHKGSYLFVYLMAQVVDSRDGRIAADFVVEIKGQQDKLTARGVATLALQIDEALAELDTREDG